MVLRLVLVSLVAGLGVSPTAGGELADWSCAVQTWLDARLAEWNTEEPLVGGPLARAADTPAADAGAGVLDAELSALWDDAPAGVETSGPNAEADARPAPADRAFASIVEEMVADFSPLPPPQSQWVDAESLIAETSVPEPAPCPPTMATLPVAEYDPQDLCDDLVTCPDEQYVPFLVNLGRGQDAASVAPVVADRPEADPAPAGDAIEAGRAENPLKNAVRLTRDAFTAWMNLLQSPALVTLTH
jgi:hypothetical protein